MTGNLGRARALLEGLAALGVRTVVPCAGARNAPLLEVLFRSEGFAVCDFFDERAAGFFAVGRCKASGAPAAVITTSGTAAAELLPAVVEAHYSALPLVVVTADRPQRFRESGAPQAIEQVGLYGPYVEQCLDLADQADLPAITTWSGARPLHLNVCFDEPLFRGEVEPLRVTLAGPRTESPDPSAPEDEERLYRFLDGTHAPLVVVGELPAHWRAPVTDFLVRLAAPVYAETPSGLRGEPRLESLRLHSGERMVADACARGDVQSILRVGGVPTLRLWRDLEVAFAHLPVLNLSHRPFCGLGRGDVDRAPTPLGALAGAAREVRPRTAAAEAILARDRRRAQRLATLLDGYPTAEAALLRSLATRLPADAFLYLGNSLPIREWDLVAPPTPAIRRIGVNRGANGIDGQVSTFLGMCRPGAPNVAVLGDLTTLYDSNAPWALRHLDPTADVTLVVVNNGGGRIFEPMFAAPRYQNPHGRDFAHWAAQWDLPYERWGTVPSAPTWTGRRVVELCPDPAASRAFRADCAALWSTP